MSEVFFQKPVYLDCNATTPMDPEVLKIVRLYLEDEFGNEGSRTHSYGSKAKQAVQTARDQIAGVVSAKRDEVIFTSGATESNNLAILGLKKFGEREDKKHIITTTIEHKAVLEPIEFLESEGFEVTRIPVDSSGAVDPESIAQAVRDDTLLVSVMHANNETGVVMPIGEIAGVLEGHPAYLHTDAAQGFGKEITSLRNKRIDLISVSGHKIFAPKGVGALVMRRRGYDRPPLEALQFGGGQERGIRPGTLPVALVAGLGKAAEVAIRDHEVRRKRCAEIRDQALSALSGLQLSFSGEQDLVMNHVMNFSAEGLDSEALMVGLKEQIAISNGSACTSNSYTPSHVLIAMGMTEEQANRCVRISWCHFTPDVDWEGVANRIRKML